MDETLALPSEAAVKIALRTQQVIAHESGITDTIDPLGGSYYLESLTDRMEKETLSYFKKLDAMGGMVAAIEKGFPQAEIHRSALRYQREIDQQERVIVGLNDFIEEEEQCIPTLKISQAVERNQVNRLKKSKKHRDNKKLASILKRLSNTAKKGSYLMPLVLDAVQADASVGEISDIFRKVYGTYREQTSF